MIRVGMTTAALFMVVSLISVLPAPAYSAEIYIDRHLPRDENREPESQSEALAEKDEDLEIPDEIPEPLTEIKPVFPEDLQKTGVAGIVLVKASCRKLSESLQPNGFAATRTYFINTIFFV